MNWLKRTLQTVVPRQGDRAVRVPTPEPLAHIEHLESRLCLGGLTSPEVGDLSTDDDLDSSVSTEVSTDLELYEEVDYGNEDDGRAEDDSGSAESGDSSPSSDPSTTSTPDDTGDGLVDGGLDSGLDSSLLENGLASETDSAGESSDEDGTSATLLEPSTETTPSSDDSTTSGGDATSGSTLQGASSSGGSVDPTSSESGGTLDSGTTDLSEHYLDADGALAGQTEEVALPPWWEGLEEPVVIKYDFRDQGGFENVITAEQQAAAESALQAWSDATDGTLTFVQDTQADASEIINIGTGGLEAFGHVSGTGGTLGLGGGVVRQLEDGGVRVSGVAWLDQAENWDTETGNGNPDGTYDYFTVAAHETGHVLGLNDSPTTSSGDIMNGHYDEERSADSVDYAAEFGSYYGTVQPAGSSGTDYDVRPMVDLTTVQLTTAEVQQILRRASAATASQDAVIAIVDRGGTILGTLAENGVIRAVDSPANPFVLGGGGNNSGAIDTAAEQQLLSFMVDGAVSKARTAAFFSNGDPNNGTLAPLTSRLVRFISQTTITQREVQSFSSVNPAISNTQRGPGFVAPIGLGGHFPPEVLNTPPVDLFAIEHTNRDRDGTAGTPRFNIPTANVSAMLQGQPGTDALREPLSFGETSGLDPNARSRGIATLPGGIPIFRDTNGDGVGDALLGGIGVFFPGQSGFADFEQSFVANANQSTLDRLNAPKVQEAEFIALAALNGSRLAGAVGVPNAVPGTIGGVAPVPNIDLPFGRLDLVGITLEVIGPIANRTGVSRVIEAGMNIGPGVQNGTFVAPNGTFTPVGGAAAGFQAGTNVLFGWIVPPRNGNGITAGEVSRIISQGVDAANAVRAAVRLPLSSRTRMVLAVSDRDGQIVGLFRMQDATVFSIDVAVAKARNVNYYADPAKLQDQDRVKNYNGVNEVAPGVAFTNRTFRFLAEPRFPSGVEGPPPAQFSTLNNANINRSTAENIGAPQPFNQYLDTVLGRNAFNPTNTALNGGQGRNTNFSDPTNPNNQNGIVFFPGSSPLYRNGQLIGGFGVSGDGVDQDDVVTFIGGQGFLPQPNVLRADQVGTRGVRLPYQKFLRNPFG